MVTKTNDLGIKTTSKSNEKQQCDVASTYRKKFHVEQHFKQAQNLKIIFDATPR